MVWFCSGLISCCVCVAMEIFSFVMDGVSIAQACDPVQSAQARHEEVLAAAKHIEGFDAMEAPPDRLLRNRKGRAFFLEPDDRIALAAYADEIAVVDPLLLQELHGGH